MFFNTSLSNICVLGIYLHSYPKDVYLLPISYSSILKMCMLGTYPHIYAQGLSTGYFLSHLS